MRKLDVNQMENLDGGKGGFFTALTCGLLLIAAGAFATFTAGTGAAIALMIGTVGCGSSVANGSNTGNWW